MSSPLSLCPNRTGTAEPSPSYAGTLLCPLYNLYLYALSASYGFVYPARNIQSNFAARLSETAVVLSSKISYNKRYTNSRNGNIKKQSPQNIYFPFLYSLMKGVFDLSISAFEEKIKALSTDYIYHQAIGSLLLLLLSAMENEEKQNPLPYDIPEDIKRIRKVTYDYLFRLEDILDDDNAAKRLESLQACFALKKELLSIYEVVYSYFSQWNICSTAISDQVALHKYKEEALAQKQIDHSLFLSDCHAFLESAKTTLQQKTYMGQLLKCIPLSMTRDKFYDTIKQCLEAAFAGESKALIDASLRAFEGFCCPENNPKYGNDFPEIAQWLEEKHLLLPHKLSDEKLAETYDDMNLMFEVLQDIEEYVSCILHDIHSLIILFYLAYSFRDLTAKDAAHSDLYHAVSEFLNGEWSETERAAYLDTLNEKLESAIEPIIDQANSIGKKEYELLQKVTSFENFHEDTQKVLMSEDFIRDCFFGNLNDALFRFDVPQDLPPATTEECDALFTAFLNAARNHFDTLPAQMRKVAMQSLMGALPPIYAVQDVMNFITEALKQAPANEHSLLIVDKAGMVFAESGFHTSSPKHPEHNHDDLSCGCEHNHEHHHHNEHK